MAIGLLGGIADGAIQQRAASARGEPRDVVGAGPSNVLALTPCYGLRPIDVGSLNRAQQLEQLGFLHISLQQPLDLGFGSAIKFVMP